MNKNKIITIVSVIVILGLVWFFVSKNSLEKVQETPIEVLERSTQDDTVVDIEAQLNSIDINASSSEDFQDTDMEIQSL
jgi:hypothetical protein